MVMIEVSFVRTYKLALKDFISKSEAPHQCARG